jgi:uncharacterized membrane protein
MYQVNSDSHQELELALLESKAIALPLQQEAPDCLSDRVCEAFSVSSTVSQELGVPLEDEGERNVTKPASEAQFEQFISNLLKYGVFVSSAVVLVGGILYLMRYGAEPADYRFFLGEPAALCSPQGVMAEVLAGHYRGIIQFGILLLIATPVARVAFSFLAFLWRRDFAYVVLTFLVLAGLIYSFIGAYA